MGSRKLQLALVVLLLAAGAGVIRLVRTGQARARAAAEKARVEAPHAPVPAGSLLAEHADFQLAIFHTPRARAGSLAAAPELLKDLYPVVRERPAEDAPTAVWIHPVSPKVYTLPSGDALEYATRFLSPEVKGVLVTTCQEVTLLDFHVTPPSTAAVLKAYRLAVQLAEATGGVLWDEETGEFYSAEDWRLKRLHYWSNTVIPAASNDFVTHAFPTENGEARLVTTGLAKFGLPDLEVKQVPEALLTQATSVVNLVAQTLVESGQVSEAGRITVDLDAIQHQLIRQSTARALKPGAKKKVTLGLVFADRKEAERDNNRLVELTFPESLGGAQGERIRGAVAQLLGAEPAAPRYEEDPAIREASRGAVKRLLEEVKPRYQSGKLAGHTLRVRAAFQSDAGREEWTWLEVKEWQGNTLTGVLVSEPGDVPGLHAGAPVKVKEDVLVDYLLKLPDESLEGNETGRLIQEKFGGRTP